MRHLITLALVALPLATAAEAGPDEGKALAEEHCARCHDVSAEGAPKTWPPSFASIAWFRAEDQIEARILFPVLHSPMPAWSDWLAPENVKDLVAYIMSLDR